MNFIKTYSEKNAVKIIAFAINFDQDLANEQIKTIIDMAKKDEFFTSNFLKVTNQTEVSFVITPEGAPQQNITENGVIFQSEDSNDSAWTIIVNKEHIVVTCKAYSRWNAISKQTYAYLQKVIDIFPIEYNVSVAQITLEYLDEFEITSPNEDWKQELFRQDNNKFLNKNVYEQNDFWHINHGYFITLDKLENKQLDTINISYFSDDNDDFKNKVTIKSQHRVIVEPVQDLNKMDFISKTFNIVHNHSKEVFENIISDNILEKFDRGE